MNLVYRHHSGGRLYQGNFQDATDVQALDKARIKVVVFAAYEKNYVHLPDRFDVIRARLDDSFFIGKEAEYEYQRCARKVSKLMIFYLSRGARILSSCAQGRNRSGLLTAATLLRCGIQAEQAIRMIRQARGPFALSNPAFVRMIHAAARPQGVIGS